MFWKSSSSKKVGKAKYCFSEKLVFSKCSVSEKVDVVQKYLFRKSSSSVDIFIQNNSSAKKVAVPPKKHLFSRSGYPVEVWRWKSSYSKKITAAKKLLS